MHPVKTGFWGAFGAFYGWCLAACSVPVLLLILSFSCFSAAMRKYPNDPRPRAQSDTSTSIPDYQKERQFSEALSGIENSATYVASTHLSDPHTVAVVVTDQWASLPFADRRAYGRNFQQMWAQIDNPAKPAQSRIVFLNRNGAEVGGSVGIDGTNVDMAP